MTRTSFIRLSRHVLPMLLAALISSACAQQPTAGKPGTAADSRVAPFQLRFLADGSVRVLTPEGKPLEPVPVKFPFKFPEKTAGVQMYNFNAFQFAGSSYIIFCMGPGFCQCIDLPEPPTYAVGNACKELFH
jgi:hypothetical protein